MRGDVHDGQPPILEIEPVDDLARMVHLAQNSSENSPLAWAVHEEFACSVKVVAGVGSVQGRTSMELRKLV